MAADKIARERQRHVIVLYAFWEPSDADHYTIFKRHRDQGSELVVKLSSDRATALSMSYRKLWDHWQRSGVNHIDQLRGRYDVPLYRGQPLFGA